jgi:uncharacterized coiled-coil protein SlyX
MQGKAKVANRDSVAVGAMSWRSQHVDMRTSPTLNCLEENCAVDTDVVERLEMKIAYLEAANGELSDVVYRQQKELEALRERMTSLVGRVEELHTKTREWTPAEEKPPHY